MSLIVLASDRAAVELLHDLCGNCNYMLVPLPLMKEVMDKQIEFKWLRFEI